MRSTPGLAAIYAIASILTLPNGSFAQVDLLRDGDAPSVQLEVMKPFLEDSNYGFATSVLDATVVVPVPRNVNLFGRMSFGYATLETSSGSRSSSALSNPRVGVLVGGRRATFGEAHVDLPFAQDYGDGDFAAEIGAIADYERQERFIADSWSLGGSVTHERELGSGQVFGGSVGGTLWMPTGDNTGFATENEAWGLFRAFGSLPAGPATLGAALSGVWLFTGEGFDFGQATTGYLTPSISLPGVSFAPQLYGRIPLDDDLPNLNVVIGLRARFGG